MENTLIIDCSAGMSILLVTKNETYKLIDNNQKKNTLMNYYFQLISYL